jgi:hypothetical protein
MPPTFILSQDQTLQFNVCINLKFAVPADGPARNKLKSHFEVFDGFKSFGDLRQETPDAYASERACLATFSHLKFTVFRLTRNGILTKLSKSSFIDPPAGERTALACRLLQAMLATINSPEIG